MFTCMICSSLLRMTALCMCGVHPRYTDKLNIQWSRKSRNIYPHTHTHGCSGAWKSSIVRHIHLIFLRLPVQSSQLFLQSVKTVHGWGIPQPPPSSPSYHRAACDACALGGTLSGLRRGLTSLLKIHSGLPTEWWGGRRMTTRGRLWDDVGERVRKGEEWDWRVRRMHSQRAAE